MDDRDELTRECLEEIVELSDACAAMIEDTADAMRAWRRECEEMTSQARIVVEQQRRFAALVERGERETSDLARRLEDFVHAERRRVDRVTARGGGWARSIAWIVAGFTFGWFCRSFW